MKIIKKQKTVNHSAENMFDLVCDIENYPLFIPGCLGAVIQSKEKDCIEARLDIGKGQIKQSFVTKNNLYYPNKIDLNLVEGPFKSFKGFWLFEPFNKTQCRVCLNLNFVIDGFWLQKTAGLLFEYVAKEMVESFSKRADLLYGKKSEKNAK